MLEALRELISSRGWRDTATGQFVTVTDTSVVCAMTEEKNDTSAMSDRLGRLLLRLYLPELTEEEKVALFWKQCTDTVPAKMLKDAGPTIAAATLQAISSVRGSATGTLVANCMVFDMRTVMIAVQRVSAVLASVMTDLDLPAIGEIWQSEMTIMFDAANAQ